MPDAEYVPDTKDYLANFLTYLEQGFRERDLGQFAGEMLGIPNILDGINIHTFYELTNLEDLLYLRGNVPASEPLEEGMDPEESVISVKMVQKEKVAQVAESYNRWKNVNMLDCKTAEEVVINTMGGKPWRMNEGFPFSGEGLCSAFDMILREMPEIRG